ALGELFRRRGLPVLAGPLHTTGLLLPLLPLLAFWLRPTPDMLAGSSSVAPGLAVLLAPLQYLPEHHSTQAILWFVTALMLLGLAVARQSMGYTIAAALTANVGLWMLLTHHGVGLFLHPQLWLVPLGLIVLAAVERTQTWVWYVSGIVLGAAILALFAVFEKRREDVLRLVDDIKRWE